MTEFDEWKAEQAAKWLEHVRSLALDVARIQDRVDVLRSLAMPSGIDYSEENQEAAAEAYIADRYGSWQAAQEHWEEYGWY